MLSATRLQSGVCQKLDLRVASRCIDDCPKCFGRPGLKVPAWNRIAGAWLWPRKPMCFNSLLHRRASIVMSAEEYRARAAALIRSSDMSTDYGLILEMEAVAAEWRKLADLADLQEAMRAALKATRE